ncbi:hypothetical protein G7054_g8703 [Neopestalotiopsis clavispora]|nr:hypothetical protein G7054_g8703 [Neopestalotiopsis clavispora]
MMSLLSPHYVLQPVTQNDMIVASLAWGFNIGFGWLTTWTAAKQTARAWRRSGRHMFRNAYVWMIWLELLVCLMFSIICWLYLRGVIPPCFGFYFGIRQDSHVFYNLVTLWALQVQFLLQIIINRCAILVHNPDVVWRLKVGVATLITAVNISVYMIWIPARLQISDRYIWINDRWDRCEKVIYLLVDAALNIYFITVVSRNLVHNGLEKYKRLARFNLFIIGFSLSMDVLIIGMMSLQNTFVWPGRKNRNNISHPSYNIESGCYAQGSTLQGSTLRSSKWGSRTLSTSMPPASAMGGTGTGMGMGKSCTLSSFPAMQQQPNTKRGKWYGHNYTTSEAIAPNEQMEMSNMATTTAASDETNRDANRDNKSIYTTREVHVEFENAPQRPGQCWPSHYGGVPAEHEEEDDEEPLRRPNVNLRSSRL